MKLIPYLIAIFVSTLGFSSSVVAADMSQESAAQTAPAATDAVDAQAAPAEAETTTTTTTTIEPAATTEMAEQAGFSRGSVIRSIFTSSIQDREPIDKLEKSAEADRVFYFTELRDMSGQTAIHRWEYDGKVMAEVKFDVRGPRWRVWSSKSFVPGWSGDWKVSVLNGAGETISEEMISLSAATAQAAEPAAATPETSPAATPDATPSAETAPASQEFEPPVSPELLQ